MAHWLKCIHGGIAILMPNPTIPRSYTAFEIDGQRYERVSEEAHTTKRGAIAIIITWRSHCADCDAEYFYTSPQKPGPTGPTRRCKACVTTIGKHKRVDKLVTRKPTGVTTAVPEVRAVDVRLELNRKNYQRRMGASGSEQMVPRAPAKNTKPDVFTDR